MDDLTSIVIAAARYGVVGLVALSGLAYAGLTLARPRFLLYPYLGVLFFVSMTTFGQLEPPETSLAQLYRRGSGALYFPLLLWLLFVAMLWADLSARFEQRRPVPCNLLPWLAGWIVLLAGHAFVGLFLKIPFAHIVAPEGFSGFAWMAVLIATIRLTIRNQSELIELSNLVVLVGLARALFGLVRWAAFGGDPSNAYANYGGLALKLTFFDINDSLLCWIALCVAALKLSRPAPSKSSSLWRLLLWTTVAASIACIVLSYRRTAWLGVLVGGAFLLLQLPPRHRLRVMLLGAPVAIAGIVYGAWTRLSQTRGAEGIDAFIHDILPRSIGRESPRLLELKLAWADFIENPIFGIGSWGQYKGWELIAWQQFGERGGTFVHSGVLHIAFHSGLVGLALTAGLLAAFARFWLRNRSDIDPSLQPLAVAGVAGVLFMLPDFIIGTPIPQVRTMQMIAFCLSLPYIAYGVSPHAQRVATAVSAATIGALSARLASGRILARKAT